MLLPKENTLLSLRNLYREILGSMYEVEEVDALWKYSLEKQLQAVHFDSVVIELVEMLNVH